MSASSIGVLRLYQSSIGKKAIMAVSGLIWIGFVVLHMYGNLKAFGGPAYFNAYAEGLREVGEPIFGRTHLLWIARIVLFGAIVAHVWAAWSLSRQSWNARPVGYLGQRTLNTNRASLSIRWGGVAIFLFILYHLAHFTWGIPGIHPNFIPGDAYHNLVVGFQSYFYIPVFLYLVATAALALHLYHGAWSMFQTLGLNNKTYTNFIRMLATLAAVVISAGFAIVPLAILFGIIS